MAIIHGYVDLPVSNYEAFKNAVIGNSYDVDGFPPAQPCQCWDLAAELWHNFGFPNNYPLTGGQDARGVWINRAYNFSHDGEVVFVPITDVSTIKKGDVIVLDATASNPYGHIFLADEDYNGSFTIRGLGQNQGSPSVTLTNLTMTSIVNGAFMGAFRCLYWYQQPRVGKRNKFNFVLFGNNRRQNIF